MSLFQRLLLVVTLAILPAIVIQVSNEVALRRARIAEAKDVALRLAYQLDDEMAHAVAEARQLLVGIARLPAVAAEDGASCNMALAGVQQAHPAYASIEVAAPDGRIFCSAGGTAAPALERSYIRDALARGRFDVGGYGHDGPSQEPVIRFSIPFRARGGERGVVLAGLPLDRLAALLRSRALPRGASFVVADGGGTVLATGGADEGWVGHALPAAMMRQLGAGEARAVQMNGLDGVPQFFGFLPATSPRHFFVGAGVARAVAMAPIARATERGAALIVIGLLLALLVTWVTGKYYIGRPVAAILGAIERWQHGDYAARARVDHPAREIARVVEAFHRLADRLQDRERQIAERDAALQRAYKTKDVLLAAVGHDLRQPLQTITIALERATGHAAQGQDRAVVMRAERAVDRMAAALDQLIDVARVEMGTVAMETGDVAIATVFDDVADVWSERALRKGLRLRIMRSRAIVRSDRVALAIILNNLVGNAVRYTKSGGILVGCRRRGGRLVIEVHDSGVGIAAQAIPTVFDEFHQLDPAANEGFGLGLSIVKGLAEQLQHPIAVRSRPGVGSCFAVSVPLALRAALAA